LKLFPRTGISPGGNKGNWMVVGTGKKAGGCSVTPAGAGRGIHERACPSWEIAGPNFTLEKNKALTLKDRTPGDGHENRSFRRPKAARGRCSGCGKSRNCRGWEKMANRFVVMGSHSKLVFGEYLGEEKLSVFGFPAGPGGFLSERVWCFSDSSKGGTGRGPRNQAFGRPPQPTDSGDFSEASRGKQTLNNRSSSSGGGGRLVGAQDPRCQAHHMVVGEGVDAYGGEGDYFGELARSVGGHPNYASSGRLLIWQKTMGDPTTIGTQGEVEGRESVFQEAAPKTNLVVKQGKIRKVGVPALGAAEGAGGGLAASGKRLTARGEKFAGEGLR